MEIKNKVKNLKTCNTDTFLSWEFNTLKDQKRDVTKLKKAIIKSGWSFPVIVWNNFVIDGAGRKKAVEEIISEGYTIPEIPYVEIEADSLQDAKAKALEVSSQFGEITKESFLEFTKDINIDFDTFEIDGMTADAFIESEEQDDEVPEIPTEPKSKLGDLYELGSHRVLCGDSTDLGAISALTCDIKADMVFTDPPYNIAYEGGSKKREMIKNDEMEDFYSFLLKVYSSFALSMKLGASIYICHADTERINFTKAFKDAGFYLSSVIIWAKNNATFGRSDYFWKHEPILYGWREGGAHTWHGDNKQDTIWNVDRPSKSEQHPTMKPIELITKAVMNSSKEGDIVLDLFLGSGSTLIASQKTGRICYGMELDPKYIDVIVQRYVDYVENPIVVKNGVDETHLWEKKSK